MNDYLKLMLECGKLIIDGIVVDGMKMPFTLIDYYNLAGKELYDEVNHNEIKAMAVNYRLKYKISNKYLNAFISFLSKEIIVGEDVNNPMEIINQNYSFTFNDNKYIPEYADIQMIMNLFDIYNVPKNHRLIYQALHRVARDYPIFPLLLTENDKKLGR